MQPPSAPQVVPTPVSQPFWDALSAEKLLMQRCDACGSWVHYPRIRCTSCLSDQLVWRDVEPAGVLYAFSVAHNPTAPWFADGPPQVIAIVELDNGVRLTTNIVTSDPQQLSIGTRVQAVFEHRNDVTLLKFRPLRFLP
jgi:uncharacterized OB-fold protein